MTPQKIATARHTSSKIPKRGSSWPVFFISGLLVAFGRTATTFHTFIHSFELCEVFGLLVARTGLVVTDVGL